MALMDTIFGQAPTYNPEHDPLANPDEKEAKDLPLHVRQCARRYESIMHGVTAAHAHIHGTQRLLVIIIILLIANKAIDVSMLSGLLGG